MTFICIDCQNDYPSRQALNAHKQFCLGRPQPISGHNTRNARRVAQQPTGEETNQASPSCANSRARGTPPSSPLSLPPTPLGSTAGYSASQLSAPHTPLNLLLGTPTNLDTGSPLVLPQQGTTTDSPFTPNLPMHQAPDPNSFPTPDPQDGIPMDANPLPHIHHGTPPSLPSIPNYSVNPPNQPHRNYVKAFHESLPDCPMYYQGKEIDELLVRQAKRLEKGAYFSTELPSRLEQAQLELLELLNRAAAPPAIYDDIMDWVHRYLRQNTLQALGHEKPTKRQQFVESLRQRLDYDPFQPKVYDLTLPHSRARVKVPVNDFLGQVHSLLSNKVLMHQRNLLFPKANPFAKPRFQRLQDVTDKDSYWIMDIDCGWLYNKAYAKHVREHNDKLVPILFFIDGTHYDEVGRLTSVPVRFTLGIFNMAARQREEFWRPLGHIPQVGPGKAVTPLQKSIEYHMMLQYILRSVVDVQKSKGVLYDLHWQDVDRNPHVTRMRMRLPTLKILGDNEGHDKNLRRYRCYGNERQKSKCRLCSCPTEHLDQPFCHYLPRKDIEDPHGWVLQMASHIHNLVCEEKLEDLKDISTHPHETAFDRLGMVFCDMVRGVYSTMDGVCLLHQILEGLLPLCHACLIGTKKVAHSKTKKKRKASLQMDATSKTPKSAGGTNPRTLGENQSSDHVDFPERMEEDEASEEDRPATGPGQGIPEEQPDSDPTDDSGDAYRSLSPEELSIQGVFNDKCKKMIDRCALNLGACLTNQSCRDFDRAKISAGILKSAKIKGSEQPHVTLILLLLLVSDVPGRELRKHLDENTSISTNGHNSRSNAWIGFLGQAILFTHMYTWEYLSGTEFERLCKYVPLFMQDIKTVLNRQEGNGMRTLKFHMLGHIMHSIYTSGPLRGLDGSYCESHMRGSKKAAQQTSRRHTAFAVETLKRENERRMINTACHQYLPGQVKEHLFKKCLPIEELGPMPQKPRISLGDHSYTFAGGKILYRQKRGDKAKGFKKDDLRPCQWGEAALKQEVEQLLQEFCQRHSHNILELYVKAHIICMDDIRDAHDENSFYADDGTRPQRVAQPTLFWAKPEPEKDTPGRHDWAVFALSDRQSEPGQDEDAAAIVGRILCFVRSAKHEEKVADFPMCVVQPLETGSARAFAGQDFLYSARLAKPAIGRSSPLRLCRCSSIRRTIVVVPAKWDDTTGNSRHANNGVYEGCDKWIVVEAKSMWNTSLTRQMKDRINET